jgi:L-amino acid N-acyltransferase YncA
MLEGGAAIYSIRLATDNDIDVVASIHSQSVKATFETLIPEYVRSRSLENFQQIWQERLANAACTTAVLVRGDEILGFASVAPSQDEDADSISGEVDRIYLHPKLWGQHQGSALMTWCERQLATDGYRVARLWVFELNKRARRFYEKLGYTEDGNTKSAHGAILLRYGKELQSISS